MQTIIPTKIIGPIKIVGPEFSGKVKVPLATFESPLWPSVKRGARVSLATSGIKVVVIKNSMTRSILLEAIDILEAQRFAAELSLQREELEKITQKSSRFAKLQDWHIQQVSNLIYIRFQFFSGDAAGHNMTTKAAEVLQNWILEKYPKLKYISISGNFCVDKKNSAVNFILGRGKYVLAEILISREICQKLLRTTPEKMAELNVKKNLLGSIISGSMCSANAHFANMLLAFYLATGQDAANIVEGSQGITFAEVREGDLYFSVTLPNIIVGTIGASKQLDFVRENLELMECLAENIPGINARRLASIAGATVLCGELSLLAAQTNPGELMRSHLAIER